MAEIKGERDRVGGYGEKTLKRNIHTELYR